MYNFALGLLVGEYDQAGNLIQEIVWLGDIPVASIRTNEGGSGVGVFYIHTDHLNAPTKLTRATDNQIVWRWDHDPFGNGTPNEDPDGNGLFVNFNLRYPGQYHDQETGLYYNYYRYYDPQSGRYVTSDPIGLRGGLNTYAYVNGNPLSFIDPLGLMGAGGLPSKRPPPPPHGKPIHSVSVAGCLGTACVSYDTKDQGAKVTVPFFMDLGGSISYCNSPPAPLDPCESATRPKPKGRAVNVGAGRHLGMTFNDDGSVCFNFGLGLGLPIEYEGEVGDLWSK